MKKTYIKPAIETFRIETAQILTGSVGYKPEEVSNTEARSKEFWGTGLFDEEFEDEEF